MSNWVCYLISSLITNQTYIGATNNFEKRLNKHNYGKGAKKTKGQKWIPIVVISGFHHKNACLSFEAGWKRLAKTRSNIKLQPINILSSQNITYISTDTRWNRIVDLLFFIHNVTLIDTKYKLNHNYIHPLCIPFNLTINIYAEDIISILPWPFFIECKNIIFN